MLVPMETHTSPGPWQRAGVLYKQAEFTTKVFLDHTVLAMATRKKPHPVFIVPVAKKAFKYILHCYK